MATINIGGQSDDIFYRYKMPELKIKIEGRGKGANTVLVNICAIAKALYCPVIYITKFFGYEFSAQIRADVKKNCFMIHGFHEYETICNALDKFIEKFVLCPICGSPETQFVLYKQKNVEVHKMCIACGNHGENNMESHRLTTYIAKDLQNPTNDHKVITIAAEKPNILFNTKTHGGEDEDLSSSEQLTVLIQKMKNENKLNDIDTIQQFITTAEQLEPMTQASLTIAKCIFTENILKEIHEYKILLQELCNENFEEQKYLLYALEVLIHDHDKIRSKIFNQNAISEIFYNFYQEDIIEMNTFIYWHQKPSKHLANKTTAKKIRQMSEEFIRWLNQPDDDDDDDEK